MMKKYKHYFLKYLKNNCSFIIESFFLNQKLENISHQEKVMTGEEKSCSNIS